MCRYMCDRQNGLIGIRVFVTLRTAVFAIISDPSFHGNPVVYVIL